jgi:chromate transporter
MLPLAEVAALFLKLGFTASGGPARHAWYFFPSFIIVADSNSLIPTMRNSTRASGLLDGVNAAALGLIAAVTVQPVGSSLTDLYTIFIAIISLLLLLRYKINSTWLITSGTFAGLILS